MEAEQLLRTLLEVVGSLWREMDGVVAAGCWKAIKIFAAATTILKSSLNSEYECHWRKKQRSCANLTIQ